VDCILWSQQSAEQNSGVAVLIKSSHVASHLERTQKMNIDELKIGELKKIAEIANAIGVVSGESCKSPHIGKKCIIRTYASGVHFGELVSQEGRCVELKNARRLWKWFAVYGISLSDVAVNGIVAEKSRVCSVVPQMTITDALEIIPSSEGAIVSIESAKVA
jgi:hypothetical protein